MLPALSIGIFFEVFFIIFSSFCEKPVVPITTLLLSFTAISRTSRVHFGTLKSIITSLFLKVSALFNFGKIPKIFFFLDLIFSNTIYFKSPVFLSRFN
tara:strand:- start:165 stop:458 length:294 start_codon:yes stop_codon:yes gene_type:complete